MKHESKHTELLDLRTHLTVAILASAQLKRKSAQMDDFLRLHRYLDQSLAQLQDDITSLETLVDHLEETQPPVPRRRRLPTHWIGVGAIFLAAKLRQYLAPVQQQATHQALARSTVAS